MRHGLLFAILLFANISNAIPSKVTPRIVKRNATGYVTPESSREEVCEVYSDHVLITRTYGDHLVQKENRPVHISNLKEAILGAFNETVSSTPATMCDGPTTVTSAEILGLSTPTIVLFQTGECGQPRLFREGPESQNLRDIVDSFCPVTHDPQE
jgi:hypothetical protein